MARKARELSKSGNYYILLKGDELFVSEEDKRRFIEILDKNFATGIVHSYELSKNKIQLVVKEGEKGISMTMKPVTTSYARYFNRVHNREGKLFADRFKSEPLETKEEIEECIANLKNRHTTTSKHTKKEEKKSMPKPKKEAVKEKPKNRNLPSWLL